MRDTVMTDRDLAILSAKENLASLAKRPGYAEAMKKPKLGWAGTIVCIVVAIAFAGLTYASWENIDATWLRWIVVLFFGAISGLCLLLAIGTSPGASENLYWGVAVIDKYVEGGNFGVLVMKEDGTEERVSTSEVIHGALRAGDVGVLSVDKNPPHVIQAFTRL